jgi:peptidoglycan/LPS O-acetylase OafA/YrhL
MIALWIMLLVTNQVAELIPTPFTTITHISAETLTGICLLLSGIGLLRGNAWANRFFLFASGMLVYAAVQATGYYIDHPGPVFVFLFILLVIITAVFVFKQLHMENNMKQFEPNSMDSQVRLFRL